MRQLSEHITSFGYAVNFPHIEIVVRISEKKSSPCQPILPLYHCHIIQAEKPLSVRLYGMCQSVYHKSQPYGCDFYHRNHIFQHRHGITPSRLIMVSWLLCRTYVHIIASYLSNRYICSLFISFSPYP